MSHSTSPDEQKQPSDVEIRISLGAIALGLVIGYVFSSILLGLCVWLLSTALGLELYKAIEKVGLRQAPRELAKRLYSRIRQELDAEAIPRLGACRTCGHPVALTAPACPQCGAARPTWNALQRWFNGLEKVCLWLFVLAIVCVTIGAITNPDEESLHDYVKQRLRDESGAIGAIMVVPFVTTRYEDFRVFSVGRCDVPGGDKPKFFLGCMGSWYPFKPPSE